MRTKAAARLACATALLLAVSCRAVEPAPPGVSLPAPRTSSSNSLEQVLATRRPAHAFGPGDLTTEEIAQLLWAARGSGAAPSLSTLPLEVYVVRGDAVSRYVPAAGATPHGLLTVVPLDVRKAIAQASGEPVDVRAAPVLIVIVSDPSKGNAKYGARAERLAAIAAGHTAQNLLLQATALGLVATPLALFDDRAVTEALLLPQGQIPLHVLAVGRPP